MLLAAPRRGRRDRSRARGALRRRAGPASARARALVAPSRRTQPRRARGRTAWAGESAVGVVRRRVRWLAERWQPHVVQVEHGMLGDALAGARPGRASNRHRSTTLRRRSASTWGSTSEGRALTHACRRMGRGAPRAPRSPAGRRGGRLHRARPPPAHGDSPVQGPAVVTIPMGVDVPSEPVDGREARPPIVLFVGSYRHPPNVDAAPAARAGDHAARLEGASRGHGGACRASCRLPAICALDGPAVRVTGMVPSVTPHLARAAVVAAPLRLGGGMRVKVVDALAAGKAVVSSTLGAQGLAARHSQELLIADGDRRARGRHLLAAGR